MEKKILNENEKSIEIDLWIILSVTLISLFTLMSFQKEIFSFIKNQSFPILLRVIVASLSQFSLAGLAITIVFFKRKESLKDYGIQLKNITSSIVFCSFSFIPYIIFLYLTEKKLTYFPFNSVWTTKELLKRPLFIKIIGFSLTTLSWGFFEGFNYVYIGDKINKRYPSNNFFLDKGAIICAIACIIIHGAINFSLEGIIESLSIMFIIYFMLLTRKKTKNSLGCIFIFIFLWNAL